MIQILLHERRCEGPDIFCPVFLCDACRRPITDHRDGIFSWSESGDQPRHFHKGACDPGERYWDELDHFGGQLST
jgi:hypothetical protein